jgi:hypothetical protein
MGVKGDGAKTSSSRCTKMKLSSDDGATLTILLRSKSTLPDSDRR